MNRKVIGLIVAVACAVIIFAYGRPMPAETSPKAESQLNDQFGNGVMMAYIIWTSGIEGKNESQVIKDAKIVKLGDRYFLRGKAVFLKNSENYEQYKWFDGADIGVDWKSVVKFYVLSPKDFDEYIAARKKAE